jgi:hypothetical protein
MSDYTPSMERLRDEYLQMRAALSYGFADLYAAEFDRALKAHDAEVAATALEEAGELRFLAVLRVLVSLNKAADHEDPENDDIGRTLIDGYFTINYADAFSIAESAIRRTLAGHGTPEPTTTKEGDL